MQSEVRLWFDDVARILPRLQRLRRITLHPILVCTTNSSCLQLPSMAEVLILHATKPPLLGVRKLTLDGETISQIRHLVLLSVLSFDLHLATTISS
jgi:hypothetical protein